MPYDQNTSLWYAGDSKHYWHEFQITPIKQTGSHCVSTSLAMLSGKSPEFFQGVVNTQNPVSWSEALKPFGKKLAYCPTDIRRLQHYLDELVSLDDLFLLCYYTSQDAGTLLSDPDAHGWICGSHVVILHGDQIIDPARGTAMNLREHPCGSYHTKRIFRVVPLEHPRGL